MDELCEELNNWFTTDEFGEPWHVDRGSFSISDGELSCPHIADGQFYLIAGSRFNDGVHLHPAYDLTDETFTGAVWEMRVPRSVRKLAEEIEAWKAKYAETAASPFQSESFGGYSYTKASGSGGSGGASWQSAFKSRLSRWRKL